MTNNTPNLQTVVRTWVTILIPFVTCLFWLFSLQAKTESNAGDISYNKTAIEKMEIRVESMNNTLQETNTNVKLIQLQMAHMTTQMENLVKNLEK